MSDVDDERPICNACGVTIVVQPGEYEGENVGLTCGHCGAANICDFSGGSP
jgi:hypothetical protein